MLSSTTRIGGGWQITLCTRNSQCNATSSATCGLIGRCQLLRFVPLFGLSIKSSNSNTPVQRCTCTPASFCTLVTRAVCVGGATPHTHVRRDRKGGSVTEHAVIITPWRRYLGLTLKTIRSVSMWDFSGQSNQQQYRCRERVEACVCVCTTEHSTILTI